ncbi:MAG: gamma-glutamylcyclotransferase [Pseudomonadota bacterium]|nr:gamma-glutamylcyclotransferase [Pseudomonadota bacterium]
MTDPYRHHPGLRGQIKPAEESFFRDMDLAYFDKQIVEAGGDPDWRYTDEVREAMRRRILDGHWDDDIWIFAYGSLMWDPAMIFTEVRRAHAANVTRSFCMWDEDARGSRAQPGLMLGIDAGEGCDGLAFRIARDQIDHETFVLFRREMVTDGYNAVWTTLSTDHGEIKGLAFVVDRAVEKICPDIPMDQQARMIAVAEGMIGTNFEYLDNMRRHLAMLNLRDPYVDDLYERVTALRSD